MICGVHPFVVVRENVSFNTFKEVIAAFSPRQPFTESFEIVARRIVECTKLLVLEQSRTCKRQK